jgi:ribosomal protein S18 acetylase RimI-like enzyme
LFFVHFQNTSFVAEEKDGVIGFLVGFVSQSQPGEAYISFAGVHPDHRKEGVALELYRHFFNTVKSKGCHMVKCVTSPVNQASIAFHTRTGFAFERTGFEVDGVPVKRDYDGDGRDRVHFFKSI